MTVQQGSHADRPVRSLPLPATGRVNETMPHTTQFVNSGPASRFITSFTNAVSVDSDGWGMIAPYGDFVGVAFITDGNGKATRQLAIQRVTKENVTQMVNAYNASRRGVTKFMTAAPMAKRKRCQKGVS